MSPAPTERHPSACRSQGYWRLPRAAAQVEARAAKSAGGKSVKKRKEQKKKKKKLEPSVPQPGPGPDQIQTRSRAGLRPHLTTAAGVLGRTEPNRTEPNRTEPDPRWRAKKRPRQVGAGLGGNFAAACWVKVHCGVREAAAASQLLSAGIMGWDEGVCVRARACKGAPKEWSGGEVERG